MAHICVQKSGSGGKKQKGKNNEQFNPDRISNEKEHAYVPQKEKCKIKETSFLRKPPPPLLPLGSARNIIVTIIIHPKLLKPLSSFADSDTCSPSTNGGQSSSHNQRATIRALGAR
jgi:hypothetical protein